MSPATINLALLAALAVFTPVCVLAWRPPRSTPADPLTVLRIVNLDGAILATVRHQTPTDAWALAADVVARTPNPHRLLIEPVLPTRS
jgi:hypothetical protein